MTDLTNTCGLCGVHLQKDKDGCGEPDCPERDEHGWVFLSPHRRAYRAAQRDINIAVSRKLNELSLTAGPVALEHDDA